jgi:hypothetical protein
MNRERVSLAEKVVKEMNDGIVSTIKFINREFK